MFADSKKRFMAMELQDRLGLVWLGFFFILCLAIAGGILVPKWIEAAAEEQKQLEEQKQKEEKPENSMLRLRLPDFASTGESLKGSIEG